MHAALADHSRLTIVDELTLSDLSPTELAHLLGIGSNLLAHHLDALEEAGLVERLSSAGDRRRKYLRLVPETLALIWEPATILAERVLFVCTANSARSQLAAALWNAGHAIPAESAGTRPAERIHPEATRAAARAGLDLAGARPRSVREVIDAPDLVVTVCDVAHEELEPLSPTARVLHWSIPDPAAVGSPSAFDDALRLISGRVRTLGPRVQPPRREERRPA